MAKDDHAGENLNASYLHMMMAGAAIQTRAKGNGSYAGVLADLSRITIYFKRLMNEFNAISCNEEDGN